MSAVYNPEADTIAEIERLELEARSLKRSVDLAKSQDDRRVLDRQLKEIQSQIEVLRARLP